MLKKKKIRKKRFSQTEEEELIRLAAEGCTMDEIASALKRPKSGLYGKLIRMAAEGRCVPYSIRVDTDTRERVRADKEGGMTSEEIAKKYGLRLSDVSVLLIPVKERVKNDDIAKVCEMRNNGYAVKEICEALGIKEARCRYIIKKCIKDGGGVYAKKRFSAKEENAIIKYIEEGKTIEEICAILKRPYHSVTRKANNLRIEGRLVKRAKHRTHKVSDKVAERRAEMAKLLKQGKSFSEVGEIVGVCYHTVRKFYIDNERNKKTKGTH